MQVTRYVRMLNYVNIVELNYRFFHTKSIRVGGIQINKSNNYVPVTTDLTRKNQEHIPLFWCSKKFYNSGRQFIDKVTYEKVCEETLQSLCGYFEELIENSPHLKNADVNYGSGVLTVKFGTPYGTYVINRQSPNRQIWLSSPRSGPKRYDFVIQGEYWVYDRDNITLHELLQSEIKDIVKKDVDFASCSYALLRNL